MLGCVRSGNPFGHVDLRVASMEEALPFYEALLPVLGFTRRYDGGGWSVFAGEGPLPATPYIAIVGAPTTRRTRTGSRSGPPGARTSTGSRPSPMRLEPATSAGRASCPTDRLLRRLL